MTAPELPFGPGGTAGEVVLGECPTCGAMVPRFDPPYRHLLRHCGAVQEARTR